MKAGVGMSGGYCNENCPALVSLWSLLMCVVGVWGSKEGGDG